MHTYKLEIWDNDENGNPKGQPTTLYRDNPDAAEVLYTYHDKFQPNGCRVHTVKVHNLCYKELAKPTEHFAQFHA